jgi:hypothetical protein
LQVGLPGVAVLDRDPAHALDIAATARRISAFMARCRSTSSRR